MKIISVFCLLFGTTALTAQVNTTLISNLNQSSNGYSSVSGVYVVANSFTTGNTAGPLVGVSLLLDGGSIDASTGTYGVFAPGIFSNSNGVPGTGLAYLGGNAYPTNIGVYFYTNLFGTFQFATNTTYWLVASSSDYTGVSGYQWNETSSTNVDAGSLWSLGSLAFLNTSDANTWHLINGSLQFSITVATPPPPPPALSISQPIVVTFPAPAGAYVLQEKSSLTATNWDTVTNAILSGTVSNQTFYILPPKAAQMFYQLTNSP